MDINSVKDTVESQADFLEIDIDRVESHQTAGPETAVKVVATDDSGEEKGFVVGHPGGPDGDQMFKRQAKEGLRNLQRVLRGEPVAEPDESDAQSGQDELAELAAQEESGEGGVQPDAVQSRPDELQPRTTREASADPDFEIAVSVDGESFDDLEAELESIVEERMDDLEAQVAAVVERVDDIEARVTDIEETFGALGN
ncbi:hypothetical protein [Halosegnis longus]|uniref:hypothetical protein n=1 Tax=Halosegnis longus TaxID=2216012 RepID=UPI00129E9037|nr:hypothetical protein [Halosegnis longus]